MTNNGRAFDRGRRNGFPLSPVYEGLRSVARRSIPVSHSQTATTRGAQAKIAAARSKWHIGRGLAAGTTCQSSFRGMDASLRREMLLLVFLPN